MLRTFVGLPLAEDTRARLVDHLATFDEGRPLPGRRVDPRDWHITLVFLDLIDDLQLARVEGALDGVALGKTFEIELLGVRAFPTEADARILWLEPGRGLERLHALQAVVQTATASCGFVPETRPYNPHLTLSRLSRPGDVTDLATKPPARVAMPVSEIAIFRRVAAESPAYAVVRRWALA